jgi:hypothetical protein
MIYTSLWNPVFCKYVPLAVVYWEFGVLLGQLLSAIACGSDPDGGTLNCCIGELRWN